MFYLYLIWSYGVWRCTQGYRLISVLIYSQIKPGVVMLTLLMFCAIVEPANPAAIRQLFYLTLNLSLVLLYDAVYL